MNINEIIKLSNEYEQLHQSGKEVEQLLKDRSDFESYTISHGNFEVKVHHDFKVSMVEYLEGYLSQLEARMNGIELELGVVEAEPLKENREL